MDAERRWRDFAPGHHAWADITAPANPPIAECNPAAVPWRGLRIDPDLGGLVPGRARPERVLIACRSARSARSARSGRSGGSGRPARSGGVEPWLLPVSQVLATPLAWHPSRPLVAGLAVRGYRAYLWIADYEARTVPVHGGVHARTALTGLGHAPVAWCDDTRLALITRGHDDAPARPAAPAATAAPVVLEAAGPGRLTFAPGIEELAERAAGRVALFDLRDETLTPLTGPALVRSISAAAPGETLAIRHAVEVPTGPGAGFATGGGTGFAAGGPDDLDGLGWETVRVSVRRARPSGAQRRWRVPGGARPAACRTPDGSRAGGPRDLPAAPSRPVPVPSRVTLRTAHADAHLTVFPGGGAAHPGTEAPPGPAVLWIDACEPGRSAPADSPAAAAAPGFTVARLSLPVHWPADATLALLHAQIDGAVGMALDRLDGPFRDHHNGRIVVAGHSFGATLALYALAHTPRLTAGIAHSGCYNRTLTPTGFQQERRSYWEVPDIYREFSAVHFADRLNGPVLIVHGADDANPATDPDQSVHLYRAIVATGGRARLVLFPREGHNLYHHETLRSLGAEHRAWLSRWCRDAQEPGT